MRILMIEDEAKLQEITLQSLRASGFHAEGAATAQDGLMKIQAAHYDLIILDLGLPDLSGTELLRRLREQHRDMPVLILTAHGDIEKKAENFAAGADDYLTKPFALAELTMRVQALLRRGPALQETTLRLADLELNRLTRQVHRAGKRIDLSAKEYALLEYLFLNAGKPLTRSMLVEKIWDQSFVGITNVLDVYIGHLRRKIDEGHEPKLIQTVRGIGYALGPAARS